MPLAAGARLGPYEIVAPIGAGGMGEVYRARDAKLKRDVALKILPESFAADPNRMARFHREAELLASLSHPNIATIYGFEENALVMELIEGETLRGPLPLETALPLARQIAEALEYAHERGIIHRDLKPANVKVTPDGAAKVLDFGLAKAIEDPAPSGSPADSPTITLAAATRAGVILGTAAYMSPEQAHGKNADRRSDIWSFGAVLYEMLTGEQAFKGESVSDTLASVLKLEPDWNRLPANTPAAIRRLLRRCLTKDRKQRLQAIGDARIAIEEVIQGQPDEAPAAVTRRPPIAWVLVALMTVIAGVALWGWLRPAPPEARNVVRLTITLPVTTSIPGTLALSRDGSRLAYVSGPQHQIYVRLMDQLESRVIPGTEGAGFLCFSPDGQWISYMASGGSGYKLKKIAVAGGPAQVLADVFAVNGPPTQDWGLDDNILFSDNGALTRIPAGGGKTERLATPDPKKGEVFYGGGQLLPGGHQVLTGIARIDVAGPTGELVALNLQTGARKILLDHVFAVPRYLPTGPGSSAGYLVYYANSTGALMGVPFDANRVEVKGSPVPVLDGVQGFTTSPFSHLSISDSGTLAYVAGKPGQGSANLLVWVDRKGVEEPLPAPPRPYSFVRLSPDGRRIAFGTADQKSDVWVYDIARGTSLKISSDQNSSNPIWTPDGKRLIYAQSTGTVVWAPADSSGLPSVLMNPGRGFLRPTSVSPDGKLVIGHYTSGKLWVLPLPAGPSVDAKPQSFLDSESRKQEPAFSPDGHWVAYRSDETGNGEIYVTPHPGPGGKILISTEGGLDPRWSRDGRELFYRTRGISRMMVVDVQTGRSFRAGKPRMLFEEQAYSYTYDVSPDGKRFLMIKSLGSAQGPSDQVTVVLNWFDELRRRAPVGGK